MNVRYVSQDQDWTEAMKACVRERIASPLREILRTDEFEISMHFQAERKRMQQRKPRFSMWLVLQTFDGRHNEIVRREGEDFYNLAGEVATSVRGLVRKHQARRRLALLNPFHISTVERTA